MKIRYLALLAFSGTLLAILGCAGSRSGGKAAAQQSAEPEFVYNRFNIHVVDSPSRDGVVSRASYANWVNPVSKHWFVPANTKLKVTYRRRGVFPGFEFTIAETGRKVYYEFNSRNTGMSPSEYLKLITAPNPMSKHVLTSKDKEGVKAGKVLVGMSKMGVRVALGHPAPHRTPSLQANEWIYWRDRYRTMVVQFGEDGKVVAVR